MASDDGLQREAQIAQEVEAIEDLLGLWGTGADALGEVFGTATQEIVRNVAQASAGTNEVTGNIAGVAPASQETGAASQELSAASELSRQSEHLGAEVNRSSPPRTPPETAVAEILVLLVRPHGSDQSARLHADLATAHARDEDLGSRVLHIQAGGERLLELSCLLEEALDDLDRTVSELGLRDQAVAANLRQLLGSIQDLADIAQRFHPASGA